LQELLNSTNSNEIRRFIRKEGNLLYWEIWFGVMINQDSENTIDIAKAKKYFFLKFGFPFLIPLEEPFPPVHIHRELVKAYNKYFVNKKKTKNYYRESSDKYAHFWSKVLTKHCDDTYSFTLSEIEEMLQWGWDNLDFFVKWRYSDIMYSRYSLYKENGITELLKKTY